MKKSVEGFLKASGIKLGELFVLYENGERRGSSVYRVIDDGEYALVGYTTKGEFKEVYPQLFKRLLNGEFVAKGLSNNYWINLLKLKRDDIVEDIVASFKGVYGKPEGYFNTVVLLGNGVVTTIGMRDTTCDELIVSKVYSWNVRLNLKEIESDDLVKPYYALFIKKNKECGKCYASFYDYLKVNNLELLDAIEKKQLADKKEAVVSNLLNVGVTLIVDNLISKLKRDGVTVK